MSEPAMLTIGQVTRLARVHLETLRYYERRERRGLLPVPPRTAAGYRQYLPETVRHVEFIKRAQELGFTLDEIEGLLTLRVTPGRGCKTVERRARSAIAGLDRHLARAAPYAPSARAVGRRLSHQTRDGRMSVARGDRAP
jgi:DNA-binding transcriptional MerR regulator